MKTQQFFSPGRVNVIGEHLDYNGGTVMPIAIGLGIKAEVIYDNSNTVTLRSNHFDQTTVFDLNETKNNPVKTDSWLDYPLGVIHLLQKQGVEIPSCSIELSSDLPNSSGLSSSAALEVLIAYLLQYPNNKDIDLMELSIFCQKVENDFVGVNCGIMDQFAVANGKENLAMCLDCNSLSNTYLPFNLEQYSLMVINSKLPRTLAGSAFNQRRSECDEAFNIISHHKDIKDLCSADLADLALIKDPIVQRRAKHALTENNRVKMSMEAMKNGDLTKLGAYLQQSYISLRDDYEVSSDALNIIIDTSNAFDACLGSRLTGAGFGGCCIALVESNKIEEYQETVHSVYKEKMAIDLDFYETKAENGVRKLS